eukprot:TRINITY_DN1774_c0_g2_i1.p1 TRINITY_DN1774_c0_g2~~TRINITY_DN1774_c0_g2_i1.p1  ORF type:complete len:622 (+),score=127.23 TRINITY_DN1774_c0_g2_i1:76-1941(+)
MRGWATVMDYARQHMRKDGDSDAQVQRKAVWVVFMWVVSVVCLITVATYPTTGVLSVMHFGLALWAWVRREVSEAYLRVVTAVGSATLIYYDMLAGAISVRMWPLFVILVDVLLVIDAPRYLTKWVVGIVVVWLLIMEIEISTRTLGMFDVYDSDSYDDRRKVCDCEKPPCAQHKPVAMWVISLAPLYSVFLLDFFLTRGFADKVLAEKSKMAAAVQAAEDIARSLAGFDLEAASACLAHAEGDLPDDLCASLRQLLANLGSYRPYLPQSMVAGQPGTAGDSGEPSCGCRFEGSDQDLYVSTPLRESVHDSASSGSLSVNSSTIVPPLRLGTTGRLRRDVSLTNILNANRLAWKNVSVVQLSIHALDLAPDAIDVFTTTHTSFLSAVLAAATANCGIVDTFTGVSVQVSFNASRSVLFPAGKALAMVKALRAEEGLAACSGAAVLAPAIVGVLGTASMRRPALVGEAPELAQRLVWYARAADVEFVCNAGLYAETYLEHPLRVVMDRVLLDEEALGDAGRQVLVYEVLRTAGGDGRGKGPQEWMYELNAAGADQYSPFNAAGRRLLLGEAQAGEGDVWAQAAAALQAGRVWDFAPRVEGSELQTGSDALEAVSATSSDLSI